MTQAASWASTPRREEVTASDIAEMRSRASRIRHSDVRQGAAYAYANAHEQGFRAEVLMRSPCPDELRPKLCGAAAYMFGVVGFMAHDLGHEDRAARWYSLAHKAAREANNWSLTARTLGLQARQANSMGHPFDAVRRIDTALMEPGVEQLAPHERAMLLALRARAHATANQVAEAMAAIDEADAYMEIEDTDQGAKAARPWSWHYDIHHHLGDTAAAFRILYDHGNRAMADPAVERYGRAFDAYDEHRNPNARTHALVTGSLATLHLNGRDMRERGLVLGHEAVLHCQHTGLRSARMNGHFNAMLINLDGNPFNGSVDLSEHIRQHMVFTGASA